MPLPPVSLVRQFDTHRLLPAKYSPNMESVLTRIADDTEHLQRIFDLDDLTNTRLLAEEDRLPGISARELASYVPGAHIINAAFTHPHPLGARFSSSRRGAWYAAFELATAKAEVLFHKSLEFAEIGWKEKQELQYDEYLADFTAPFHDLREGKSFAEFLDPDSYVASQMLAEKLLEDGSQGIVYPSVRRSGGICLACFRPSLVANVRKAERYKLTWTPERGGNFTRAR